MNIIVKLGVSQNTDNHTFSLDDLGFTKFEWNRLSDQEKESAIQKAIFNLPN